MTPCVIEGVCGAEYAWTDSGHCVGCGRTAEAIRADDEIPAAPAREHAARPAMTGPEALADRLEEAALASLPEVHWTASNAVEASLGRDARIARAAEWLLAALGEDGPKVYDLLAKMEPEDPASASPAAAWNRLAEAVEGGRECRHGRPLGQDCGSCDLAPQPASQNLRELGLIAEAAARAERARIRQMALEEAERIHREWDGQAGNREDALRDFAALLAPPAPPAPAPSGAQSEPPTETVLDLMEALKASLRAARPGWKPGDDPAAEAPAEGGAE